MTFRRAVGFSIALHALILIVNFTCAFVSPGEPVELRDAIRVDIVGLPQKIKPDEPLPPPSDKALEPAPPKADVPEPAPAAPPKSEAPKFVDKPKPAAPVIDVRKSQKSALNRLKEMDAFAKLERAETKAAPAPKVKAVAVAGHQITAGQSLVGIARLDFDRYGAELKNQVLSNWAVPGWLLEADLNARVRVWLDEDGRVTKKQIVRPSGNEVFDAAALEAVAKSDPFPPPPENLRGVLAVEGFTLGLPK